MGLFLLLSLSTWHDENRLSNKNQSHLLEFETAYFPPPVNINPIAPKKKKAFSSMSQPPNSFNVKI